jgi:hypothetical protein
MVSGVFSAVGAVVVTFETNVIPYLQYNAGCPGEKLIQDYFFINFAQQH